MTLEELAQKASECVVTQQMADELEKRLQEAEVMFEEIAKAKKVDAKWLNQTFSSL